MPEQQVLLVMLVLAPQMVVLETQEQLEILARLVMPETLVQVAIQARVQLEEIPVEQLLPTGQVNLEIADLLVTLVILEHLALAQLPAALVMHLQLRGLDKMDLQDQLAVRALRQQ